MERRAHLLEAYRDERHKRTRHALRIAGAIIAIAFLADGILALLTQPDMYAATFGIRIAVGIYALGCVLAAGRLPSRLAPAMAVGLGIGVAIDVAVGAANSGGLNSPWVSGELLVLVGAGLLFPLVPVELAIVAAAVWCLDLLVVAPAAEYTSHTLLATLFFLGVASAVATVATVTSARMRLREFLTRAEIAAERERSEGLLLNILPAAIARRLKQAAGTIADAHGAVTVLFADIVGFTEFAADNAPQEVVAILEATFSAFDELCTRHGLEKIKTIGDAYMAVAGLPEPRPDHAEAAAHMALDAQTAVHQLAQKRFPGLQVRVGLHCGPVVAGVIGAKKFSYDLWGDTVNIASRMESQGEAGRVQVSEDLHARLAPSFVLESRGSIEVKGRGLMETFWLVGKHGEKGS